MMWKIWPRTGDAARNAPQPVESTDIKKSARSMSLSQEKDELQDLNNRLAGYVDRVRLLNTENSRLIQQLRSSKDSVELLYKSEIDALREALDREADEKNRVILENIRKTIEVQGLKTKLDKTEKMWREVENARVAESSLQKKTLLATNNDLSKKITDLERLNEIERTKNISEIHGLNSQLTAMQDDLSQNVKKYQNLMDIKMELDIGISAYRKLLESEERRLSVNTSVVGRPKRKKRKLLYDESTN